jgi:hypothetical protein
VRFNQLFLFGIFFFCVASASAQDNQPYTRYGIGQMLSQSPAALRGWGDLAAADQDPFRFNVVNPASLGSLSSSVLQVGVNARGTWLKAGDSINKFGTASVEYISLAIPVMRNKWGMSIGLLPYSQMNYSIVQLNDENSGLPASVNRSRGEGGLYEAYLASGWQFGHFSFGAKAAYLFGNTNQTSLLVFDDTLNGFNTRYRMQRSLSGFTWNLGVQYYFNVGLRDRLQLGASGNISQNVNAKRDYLYERFYYDGGVETVMPGDTIASAFNNKGKVTFPTRYQVGLIYKRFATEKHDIVRWQAGVNFSQTLFDDYKDFGNGDSLQNSFRVSAGFEWTPKDEAIEGYYNRVRYRLGGYYGSGELKLLNNDFTRYGINVGLGLPLRRLFSFVDVSLDYGNFGPTDKKLLQQQYMFGTLGFTFSDRWFIKRRYE